MALLPTLGTEDLTFSGCPPGSQVFQPGLGGQGRLPRGWCVVLQGICILEGGGGQRSEAPGPAECVLTEWSWDGASLARREKPPAPDHWALRVGVRESKEKSSRTGPQDPTGKSRGLNRNARAPLLGVRREGLSRRPGCRWGVTVSP